VEYQYQPEIMSSWTRQPGRQYRVIERHRDIFFTTPYSLIWARAHINEKGRVERAIRFVRENFFAARKFVDLDDLNAQAALWCAGPAADRPCREEPAITVREAFAREQPSLWRCRGIRTRVNCNWLCRSTRRRMFASI
jgi:hypothetical protein